MKPRIFADYFATEDTEIYRDKKIITTEDADFNHKVHEENKRLLWQR